ncbi:hypothetical protein WN55_05845 [Dufourea novaeangliae]|uniref:Uncharacterized protein n=1 Tax=Dufourea novaeangliae TaxID=178035 RepID=A0A154P082_DUFNO|nr:hypothetical protein WN55_05845 [Dufourea novaeangliae]
MARACHEGRKVYLAREAPPQPADPQHTRPPPGVDVQEDGFRFLGRVREDAETTEQMMKESCFFG